GVLADGTLGEAVERRRARRRPAPVDVAVGDVSAGRVDIRVEHVLPVLRAGDELVRPARVAGGGQQLRQREVVGGVFERFTGATPRVRLRRHVVQLEQLVEGRPLPDRLDRLAGAGQVERGRYRRGRQQ